MQVYPSCTKPFKYVSKMPEQKDLSTPSDWSDRELASRVRRVLEDNFDDESWEYWVLDEAVDRLLINQGHTDFGVVRK